MINWQEAPKTWQESSKKLTGNVGLPFSLGALGTSTSALHPGTVYMKVEAAVRGSSAMASGENWTRYVASWHFQKPQ